MVAVEIEAHIVLVALNAWHNYYGKQEAEEVDARVDKV